jgi:hypothetical protein
MNRVFGRLVCAGIALLMTRAFAWEAGKAPLMTRWAASVSPTNCHPEYPRPQLVRTDWKNLNGLWDYAVRQAGSTPPEKYDGQILVPFPIESALSGVMKTLGPTNVLWYRRTVRIPPEWKGRRIRLQFGAADWQCKVIVNGREAGQHRGGYDRFAFDITDCLHWDRPEEIIVMDTDPTEGDQPRGKQSLHPQGIFYSSNSGIWQTVWLEPVPTECIDSLKMTPELDTGLRLQVAVNTLDDDLQVEAIAFTNGVAAGRVGGRAGADLTLLIAHPKLWSPDSPFLYDLEVILKKDGNTVDRVSSYFGMRQATLGKDGQGIARILLNGDPMFQIGTLDQGFWPDGIYTAPSDDALRSDLEFLKAAGFNMTRKHVKIEPDRWYYWCDKLGLLVWQDMPSGNNTTPEGQREFESELLHMVKDLYNHPSIILWILFNEGWGQYDTQRLTQCLKSMDPSRLVDDASGWADAHVGDVVDGHSYPGPSPLEPDARRAMVVGEFGGVGRIAQGHCWSSNRNWAYRMEPDSKTLGEDYLLLLREVWNLHHLHSLSGAVYTQTTDVETECNGLLSYDRAVAKLSPEVLAQANAVGRDRTAGRVVVPDAISADVSWSYTFQAPGPDWFKPGYNPADWKEGVAGFGTPGTPGALVHTIWNTGDIWLRRPFTLGDEDLQGIRMEAHHDEDLEVYLNGVLAAKLPGFIEHYEQFDLQPEAVATLKPGVNLLAVHCHQTTGGQYVDVGLVLPDEPKTPKGQ